MRRIDKNATTPASLLGLTAPESTAGINPSLYKGADVKHQLYADQHRKCAYCECRLNGDYGHIEHFRPKAGYSVPPDNILTEPGYYWLAYDWSNLLLSCSTCNTTYKKNHFALEDESARDITHRDISRETALLINPSAEDPDLFIEFHQHIVAPRSIDGRESAKGRHTIDLLKLNHRPGLVGYRREIWEKFKRWEDVAAVAERLIATGTDTERGQQLLQMAASEMTRMKSEEGEYSAMFL